VPPAYRFLDRWVVAAPIERVYDAIGDVLGYKHWWTDFVLRATGDEAPPAPGKRNELLVKAYLPYTVDFGLEVIGAERPRRSGPGSRCQLGETPVSPRAPFTGPRGRSLRDGRYWARTSDPLLVRQVLSQLS
jgi:hypothetical protein